MLVIRLSRFGKKKQPAYRIVVAEKSKPVQGKFLEWIGSYNPYEGKKLNFKKDRVEYWVSQGARPSDSVASLLKQAGIDGMEDFIGSRDKKAKRKKEVPEEEAPAPAPAAEAAPQEEAAAVEEPVAEAPAEEAAPAPVEEPKEEAPEEAAPAEEPAEEEKADA